jgi:hypothetical protein
MGYFLQEKLTITLDGGTSTGPRAKMSEAHKGVQARKRVACYRTQIEAFGVPLTSVFQQKDALCRRSSGNCRLEEAPQERGSPLMTRIFLLGAALALLCSPASADDTCTNGPVPSCIIQDDGIAHAQIMLGISGTQQGSATFAGATSGSVKITPQAVAGTSVTVTLPNTSGTLAANASSPLALSATTGNLTCATCAVTGSGNAGSILSSSSSGGIGYTSGAGGTVTQTASRTTGVTLNTVTGAITLVSAAGSASFQSFTVTNSSVAASDTVNAVQKSGTDKYQIFVTNVSAGSFVITFATTGGTTTEQPVFNFTVTKGATS